MADDSTPSPMDDGSSTNGVYFELTSYQITEYMKPKKLVLRPNIQFVGHTCNACKYGKVKCALKDMCSHHLHYLIRNEKSMLIESRCGTPYWQDKLFHLQKPDPWPVSLSVLVLMFPTCIDVIILHRDLITSICLSKTNTHAIL